MLLRRNFAAEAVFQTILQINEKEKREFTSKTKKQKWRALRFAQDNPDLKNHTI